MYTPLQFVFQNSEGPGNIRIGPDIGRQWLIELATVGVEAPGVGDFNVLICVRRDRNSDPYVDRVFFCDVRITNVHGLIFPFVGGGVFQQYNIADPNAAILQPSMRRLHLVYPAALDISLLLVPSGVNWEVGIQYRQTLIEEHFCYPA